MIPHPLLLQQVPLSSIFNARKLRPNKQPQQVSSKSSPEIPVKMTPLLKKKPSSCWSTNTPACRQNFRFETQAVSLHSLNQILGSNKEKTMGSPARPFWSKMINRFLKVSKSSLHQWPWTKNSADAFQQNRRTPDENEKRCRTSSSNDPESFVKFRSAWKDPSGTTSKNLTAESWQTHRFQQTPLRRW